MGSLALSYLVGELSLGTQVGITQPLLLIIAP